MYNTMRRLNRRVLYCDTDSVIFKHKTNEWKPKLGIFLGDWTDEVAPEEHIVDFVTCGPKNYSYTIALKNGQVSTKKKVKGIRLTEAVEPLITKSAMEKQVELYTHKRRGEPVDGAPPKRECLMVERRRTMVTFNQQLNAEYKEQGIEACLNMRMEAPLSGPCHCVACSSKTSVSVPQVRFDKKRRDGHVETASLNKDYRLVMNKRWALPGETKTWPFGFKH